MARPCLTERSGVNRSVRQAGRTGSPAWYILSATGVAFVLLLILDAPFHRRGLVRSNWAENRQRTRSGANRETAGEKDTAGKNGPNENA